MHNEGKREFMQKRKYFHRYRVLLTDSNVAEIQIQRKVALKSANDVFDRI